MRQRKQRRHRIVCARARTGSKVLVFQLGSHWCPSPWTACSACMSTRRSRGTALRRRRQGPQWRGGTVGSGHSLAAGCRPSTAARRSRCSRGPGPLPTGSPGGAPVRPQQCLDDRLVRRGHGRAARRRETPGRRIVPSQARPAVRVAARRQRDRRRRRRVDGSPQPTHLARERSCCCWAHRAGVFCVSFAADWERGDIEQHRETLGADGEGRERQITTGKIKQKQRRVRQLYILLSFCLEGRKSRRLAGWVEQARP